MCLYEDFQNENEYSGLWRRVFWFILIILGYPEIGGSKLLWNLGKNSQIDTSYVPEELNHNHNRCENPKPQLCLNISIVRHQNHLYYASNATQHLLT